MESDEEAADMVSLRAERTGVANTIFVSTKGYAQPAPRIKIAVDPPGFGRSRTSGAPLARDQEAWIAHL
jgi:hypothetical protein